VSYFSPLAVIGLALVAAPAVWLLEQLVAGVRPTPGRAAHGLRVELGSPLQRPDTYDSALFHLAPALLVLAAVVALATVPWAPGFRGIDFQAGALLFGAALAYVTPAMLMAGWGAGRPLAVVGGFRWVG